VGKRFVTEEIKDKIRIDYLNGESVQRLAFLYKVSQDEVREIAKKTEIKSVSKKSAKAEKVTAERVAKFAETNINELEIIYIKQYRNIKDNFERMTSKDRRLEISNLLEIRRELRKNMGLDLPELSKEEFEAKIHYIHGLDIDKIV
jgi:aminopeptidase N